MIFFFFCFSYQLFMIDIYYYFSCVKTDFLALEGVGMEGRLTMNMPIALSIEPVFFLETLVANIHVVMEIILMHNQSDSLPSIQPSEPTTHHQLEATTTPNKESHLIAKSVLILIYSLPYKTLIQIVFTCT